MAVAIQRTPLLGTWRGLHQRKRESDVDPMYARRARNVEFFGNVIAPRGGTHRLNLVPAAGRVHALHHARFRNTTDEVIAAAGAKLQRVATGATVVDPPVDLPLSLPAGTPARVGAIGSMFASLANLVFHVNGVDLDVKYDGAAWTKFGLDAPTAAPLLTNLTAGALTGTFGVIVTYVNAEEHESEGSAQARITLTAQKLKAQAFASTDPQTVKTRFYRTTTGGDGVWFFWKEIATNGGIVEGDESDDLLGAQLERFLNEPPPGPLRLVVSWPQAGRMLGVPEEFPSMLLYTDLGLGFLKPESWPPENLVLVNFDDGDEILAVLVLFDSVIIRKTRSTWRLRGIPPDLTLEPISFDADRTGIGAIAQAADIVVDNDAFLPSLDGAYDLSRYSTGGFETTRLSRAIDDLWQSLQPSSGRRAHAVFHRFRRQIRFFAAANPSDEPNVCLVYQLDGTPDGQPNGWAVWEVSATASVVVETASGDVVWIGTADGLIKEMDAAHEDDWTGDTPGNGQAIQVEYEGHFFAPAGDTHVDARGRFLDLSMRENAPGTLLITPRTDWRDGPSRELVLRPVATFVLDTDPPSVAGAGVLDDVDSTGAPAGAGTALGEAVPHLRRVAFLSRGRYHTVRIFCGDLGADWAIENMVYSWQPLPLKARAVDVLQGAV